MARQDQMRRLFALQGKAGITEEQRHGWATEVLGIPVTTYRSLTSDQLDELAAAAERIINGSPEDDYVMCGEVGPDDLSCVVDAGHFGRGEDCADEFGRTWVLR